MPDSIKQSQKTTVRTDSGEIVRIEEMSPAEMQEKLEFKED